MRIRYFYYLTFMLFLLLLLTIKSSAVDKESPNYGITHKNIFNSSGNCTLCHLFNNFAASTSNIEASNATEEDEYEDEYEDEEGDGGLGWFFGKQKKVTSTDLKSYVNNQYTMDGFIASEAIMPHEFVKRITDICVNKDCHTNEELGPSHAVDVSPYERYPAMKVPDELPLNWDTEKYEEVITCGTCHNPHIDRLSQKKSYDLQKPTKVIKGREYYMTNFLRIQDPVLGYYTLCKSCHGEGY